jgi:hypothetical protein
LRSGVRDHFAARVGSLFLGLKILAHSEVLSGLLHKYVYYLVVL